MIPDRNFAWRTVRLGLAVAMLAALAALTSVSVPAASFGTLEIATKSGVHIFSVEMATTEDEKQKGLMYRKELADGKGMLFDFSPEQPISMWMKNTYISLDMIFIRADGRIQRIAENTQTESDRIIPSGGPVRAVLEVVAGTAKKFGIAAGDRVASPIFRR